MGWIDTSLDSKSMEDERPQGKANCSWNELVLQQVSRRNVLYHGSG